MRLPRDLSTRDLARRLERQYGYRVSRTKGSYMTVMQTTHQVQAPPPRAHRRLQERPVREMALHRTRPLDERMAEEICQGLRSSRPSSEGVFDSIVHDPVFPAIPGGRRPLTMLRPQGAPL